MCRIDLFALGQHHSQHAFFVLRGDGLSLDRRGQWNHTAELAAGSSTR